jgi:hypothetical protein
MAKKRTSQSDDMSAIDYVFDQLGGGVPEFRPDLGPEAPARPGSRRATRRPAGTGRTAVKAAANKGGAKKGGTRKSAAKKAPARKAPGRKKAPMKAPGRSGPARKAAGRGRR